MEERSMHITFLGHQGWQFENNQRSFLLDPILEEIGNGAAKLPVWPRRRLDLSKFEPLDAVIISHEHADHFSLETLAALPRRCRIFISDLSSNAMATVIAELGFEVKRFTALQPFTVCGLQITALPGLYNLLEPDTYALLVKDASGASFLTAIDTVAHPDVVAWLAAHCPLRTLDNLTNNFIEPRTPLVRDPSAFKKSRSLVAANAMEFVQNFAPRRAVVSGQGWSFGDSKLELNHSYFSVDNKWLTRAARELAPQVEWFEGIPGMRFNLRGEQIAVDQSSVIGALQYPSREFDPASAKVAEPYVPWAEIGEISVQRFAKVREFICNDFGQVLGTNAPKLMERLYYLKFQTAGNVAAPLATFAIVVRNGAKRFTFEFDYGQLLFREVVGPPRPHAVGIEMWAADLELIIDAQEDAFTVYESAVRTWTHVPNLIADSTLIESFMWFTPRFRPREFLSFYRSRLAMLRQPQSA
jgi:hypothetical protein